MNAQRNAVATPVNLRGPVLTTLRDGSVQFYPDAAMGLVDGRIQSFFSSATSASKDFLKSCVKYAPDELIVPGFIDLHTHFGQTQGISRFSGHLLEWLNQAIFPAEARLMSLDDEAMRMHCRAFFLNFLKVGTTTASVFGVSSQRVMKVFLEEASLSGVRVISGMALMDRNAPDTLIPTRDLHQWKDWIDEQIEETKNYNDVFYSLCPRYAPSCSDSLLELSGKILADNPDVYLQTHLSETREEVTWVKELFPKFSSYTHVYDAFGCLGPKSLLAHGIYCTDQERELLIKRKAGIVHCPTANLFLGSGMMSSKNYPSAAVGLGTDIGAGTTYSILKTAGFAYQIALLDGMVMGASDLLKYSCYFPAKALGFEDVGWIGEGACANFVVLSPPKSKKDDDDSFYAHAWKSRTGWEEKLFLAMTALDWSSCVLETWTRGQRRYQREPFA